MKNYKIELKNILGVYEKGEETTTFIYELNGRNVLLRTFNNLSEEYLNNKKRKLEIINSSDVLKKEMNNIGLATVDNKPVGYFIEINPEYICDISKFKRKNDKINIIKSLRNKLEILNENNIYIANFNKNDVLANDKASDTLLYNLDKFKYGDLDFDEKTKNIDYIRNLDFSDKEVDSYIFNSFTIEYLEGLCTGATSIYLANEGLPKVLDNKKNENIALTLRRPFKGNYIDGYLIDNLNKRK